MTDIRSSEVMARYSAKVDQARIKGAGGVACAVFVAVLGCAFWAGAVFASTPWPH